MKLAIAILALFVVGFFVGVGVAAFFSEEAGATEPEGYRATLPDGTVAYDDVNTTTGPWSCIVPDTGEWATFGGYYDHDTLIAAGCVLGGPPTNAEQSAVAPPAQVPAVEPAAASTSSPPTASSVPLATWELVDAASLGVEG